MKRRLKKNAAKKPPNLFRAWAAGFEPFDLVAAFSLAHLCFLRVWTDHLIPQENAYFDYTRHLPGWQNVVGLWLAAGLLFLPLAYTFRAARLAPPLGRRLANVALPLLFVLQVVVCFNLFLRTPGDAFHAKNFFYSALSADALWILVAEAVALLAWAMVLRGPQLARAVRALLVLLAPFPLLVSLGVLANSFTPLHRTLGQTNGAPVAPTSPRTRTVVVVMDELDQDLIFASPSRLAEYPNFAALKRESLHATAALPPSQHTLLSLPSYWYGKNATRIWIRTKRAPEFEFFGEGAGRALASQRDLFSELAQSGVSTEIVGWSHPYCDLFGGVAARCFQSSYHQGNHGHTVADAMGKALARFTEVVGAAGLTDPGFLRAGHRAAFAEFHARSLAAVADPRNRLVWLHLPIPHEPIIYDSARRDFRTGGALLDGNYFDNVALADRTLGDLKARLQAAGLWESTHLILLSDHAYRHTVAGESAFDLKGRTRVPFLFKPAGSDPVPLNFTSPFSTRLVGPLVARLVRGELSTAPQVARWMEAERAADLPFLRTAYALGRKRCIDHPFTSQRDVFTIWSAFLTPCDPARLSAKPQ